MKKHTERGEKYQKVDADIHQLVYGLSKERGDELSMIAIDKYHAMIKDDVDLPDIMNDCLMIAENGREREWISNVLGIATGMSIGIDGGRKEMLVHKMPHIDMKDADSIQSINSFIDKKRGEEED